MDALWPDDVAAMAALLGDDPAHAAHAAVGCAGVDELLSFLDGGDAADDVTSSDAHSERSHSPSPSVAAAAPADTTPAPLKRTRARGGSSQMKRSLEELRSEATQLALELEQLQAHSRRTRSAAMERALAERFKRRRAESERQQLRHAVLAQQRFVRGLRSVFSSPPSFASGLNMCHYLHDYTRLPRDRAARQREYATLSDETRLRYAMDILCRETESLTVSGSADDVADDVLSPSLAEPFVQVEMVPEAGGFNVTTTSVYALERGDVAAVLRGVCIAACDLMSTCPAYPTTGIEQSIVDADATSAALLYRAMDVSYKSLDEQDALVVASRGLTICKQTEREAVVVWDYVDDDELHEITPEADITRQAVGACLIRREICADGRERTVYRALSTRRYRYHERAPRDALQRYYLDSRRRMRTNELLFRDILVEAVACEAAATAEAQCRRALCRP